MPRPANHLVGSLDSWPLLYWLMWVEIPITGLPFWRNQESSRCFYWFAFTSLYIFYLFCAHNLKLRMTCLSSFVRPTELWTEFGLLWKPSCRKLGTVRLRTATCRSCSTSCHHRLVEAMHSLLCRSKSGTADATVGCLQTWYCRWACGRSESSRSCWNQTTCPSWVRQWTSVKFCLGRPFHLTSPCVNLGKN